MSFSADPCSTHIHTHTYFALRKHSFKYYLCFTATQTGLQEPGDSSPSVCVSVRAHIHSADMCVTLPAGMWACGSHSGMLAHMCRFVLYLCRIKQKKKMAAFESHGKCIVCLNCCKSVFFRKLTLSSALTL